MNRTRKLVLRSQGSVQPSLFDSPTSAEAWDPEAAGRALDELFNLSHQYRSSQAFRAMLDFVARFRFYAPFNAMLAHIQMPGATYVAPPARWLRDYGRRIKAGARPIVILQPMGPVMFVFDVADTEAEEGAPLLPPEVVQPFEVRKGRIGGEFRLTVENARRDGVEVVERAAGSQDAGMIRTVSSGRCLEVLAGLKPKPQYIRVPLRYEILLNERHSKEAKYATLAHELAHLYCGHLGTPNDRWWPDRQGLPIEVREFEAEAVCYLLCKRLGIDNPSEQYLSGYLRDYDETPPISLDCVMKAAGLIEQMGRQRMKPRKEKE